MFGKISGMFGILKPLEGISGWFVRLPFAAVFLYHGITKFTGGIDGFAGMMSDMGAMAMPVAIIVALAEVLAGFGILVGTFMKNDMGNAATHLAGLAAAPVMLGAIFLIHLPNGWNVMEGGAEFQTLLLGLAIYYMVNGNKA